MNIKNETHQGEVYSFWKLLENQKIEIPIIQRDYAQGREGDKKKLRRDFLEALFKAIDEGNPIRLDFIYGSNIGEAFQPLDGQQRLTTLFLLHWYGAIKNGDISTETKKYCPNLAMKPEQALGNFVTD